MTSLCHYCDVMMSAMASQTTSLTIVYSIVHAGADQKKRQSSASLAFMWGIHHAENVYIWWCHHVSSLSPDTEYHTTCLTCDLSEAGVSFSWLYPSISFHLVKTASANPLCADFCSREAYGICIWHMFMDICMCFFSFVRDDTIAYFVFLALYRLNCFEENMF